MVARPGGNLLWKQNNKSFKTLCNSFRRFTRVERVVQNGVRVKVCTKGFFEEYVFPEEETALEKARNLHFAHTFFYLKREWGGGH